MTEKEFDHLIKILLIGDDKVGKSSYIKRIMEDKFSNELIDIKELENKTKILEIEGKLILNIQWNWNQFKNKANKKELYLKIQGIPVFFDLSKKNSFSNVDYYLEEIRNKCGSDMPLLIIGNKSDLTKLLMTTKLMKNYVKKIL